MVGPGDESAAGPGRYSYVRASHAEREQVVDALKAAFVQGRLAKDEFDLRVGRVLGSRTHADLNALTVDLPAGLIRAQPPQPIEEPDHEPALESAERKVVKAFACLLVAAPSTVFGVALMESQNRPELGVAARVFLTIALACILAVPATGLVLFHSWLEKRPGTEPTPGPPPGGAAQASQRMMATRFSTADPRA
jgi:Domain of unknown function (DUF1707)